MDVNLLEPEELQVELEIRQIPSGPSNVELLQAKILAEAQFPILVPTSLHVSGSRNPTIEVRLCALKLTRISSSLEDASRPLGVHLQQLCSRLWHIKGRLIRLHDNHLETDQVITLIQDCDTLLGTVQRMATLASNNHASNQQPVMPNNISQLPPRSQVNQSNLAYDTPVPVTTAHVPLQPSVCAPGEKSGVDWSNFLIDLDNAPGHPVKSTPLVAEFSQRPEVGADLPHSRPVLTPNVTSAIHSELVTAVNNFGSMIGDLGRIMAPKTDAHINSQKDVSNTRNASHDRHTPNVARTILGWHLQFSGSRTDIPVERFVARVDQMAQSSGINLNQNVPNVMQLLSDAALEFGWTTLERDPSHNWNSLKQELINRFSRGLSNREIRRMLDARKQRYPIESYGDFFDGILQIAQQAPIPISDAEILDVLLNNVRPGLQLALASKQITTIGQLAQEARYLENLWKQLRHNPESGLIPSRHQIHELNDQHITPVDQSEAYDEVNALGRSTRRPSHTHQAPTERSTNRCWNCHGVGHTFQLCREARSIFCFGCGLPNTYLPDCPQCQHTPSLNSRAKESQHRGGLLRNASAPRKPELIDAAANTDPEFYHLLQKSQKHS